MNKKYLPVIMGGIAALGVIVGMRLQATLGFDQVSQSSRNTNLLALTEAIKHIEAKYYGDFDVEEAADALIGDMVSHLDPFSRYYPPEEKIVYQDNMAGYKAGIGVELLHYRDSIYIVDLIAGGPADIAGIQLGDVLLSVDTFRISGAGASSLQQLPNYQEQDTIDVQVLQMGSEIADHRLILERTKQELLRTIEMDTNTVYIRLNKFYNGSFQDVMNVFDLAAKEGKRYKYLLFDLRDNPGGLLDEAVMLLNQLIREKKVKLISSEMNNEKVKDYFTNGRSFLNIERTVVLINGGSASASEILAGSLKDLNRAVIVGDTSYGKGMIQQSYELSNGGSISITTGRYILPNGKAIAQQRSDAKYISGITPHILVADTCEDDYTQRKELQEEAILSRIWGRTKDQWISHFTQSNTMDKSCELSYNQAIIHYVSDALDTEIPWSLLISLDTTLAIGTNLLKDKASYDQYIKEKE